MTTASAPVVSREILEDRWHGLVESPDSLEPLGLELANLLNSIIVGVTRNDDDRALSGNGAIEAECMRLLQTVILARIDERGLGR